MLIAKGRGGGEDRLRLDEGGSEGKGQCHCGLDLRGQEKAEGEQACRWQVEIANMLMAVTIYATPWATLFTFISSNQSSSDGYYRSDVREEKTDVLKGKVTEWQSQDLNTARTESEVHRRSGLWCALKC